jgi:hypothetical protein
MSQPVPPEELFRDDDEESDWYDDDGYDEDEDWEYDDLHLDDDWPSSTWDDQCPLDFHGLPSERFLFDYDPDNLKLQFAWDYSHSDEESVESGPIEKGCPTSYLRCLEVSDMIGKLIEAAKQRKSLAAITGDGNGLNELDKIQAGLAKEDNCICGTAVNPHPVMKWSEVLEKHLFKTNDSDDTDHLNLLDVEKEIKQLVSFLKNILMQQLNSCLPVGLPFPALSSIIDHLLSGLGKDDHCKLGLILDDEGSLVERNEEFVKLEIIFDETIVIFSYLKDLLFTPQFDSGCCSTLPISVSIKTVISSMTKIKETKEALGKLIDYE